MTQKSVAILHYSAPPIIGGVEAVIDAHVKQFVRAGNPVSVVAGRGAASALPPEVDLLLIPEIDSQYGDILSLNSDLEKGHVPDEYQMMENRLVEVMGLILEPYDHTIIHNIFTKHFNLPLTGALHRLLDQSTIKNAIAWCHDFTWTSPSSRSKVHPGYPWDLLRTKRDEVTYVTVSQERQSTLAELFDCPSEQIHVIYNGVDPMQTLGLSSQGFELISKLRLFERDINLLMPVRVTKAKNIEFALLVLAEIKSRGLKSSLVVTGPPDPHDAQSMQYFQSLKDLRSDLGLVDEMHFVFECGHDPATPNYIDAFTVGDLYRVSDVMFMPSHREGFGMPVLEAGLSGILVVSSEVPASHEIGQEDVLIYTPDDQPCDVAKLLIETLNGSPVACFRKRIRQNYTWQAIFDRQIQPLIQAGEQK